MLTKLPLASVVGLFALSASFTSAAPAEDDSKHVKSGTLTAFNYADSKISPGGAGHSSSTPVFYLATGQGFCGINYRDESEVACISSYWLKPFDKGGKDNCKRYVKVTNPTNGITIRAQALDSCGSEKETEADKNGISLSLRAWQKLSGKDFKANYQRGNLGTPVQWQFVTEPCEACWGGVFAHDDHRKEDSCKGADDAGNMRCGRMKGDARIMTTEGLKGVCTPDHTCPA